MAGRRRVGGTGKGGIGWRGVCVDAKKGVVISGGSSADIMSLRPQSIELGPFRPAPAKLLG